MVYLALIKQIYVLKRQAAEIAHLPEGDFINNPPFKDMSALDEQLRTALRLRRIKGVRNVAPMVLMAFYEGRQGTLEQQEHVRLFLNSTIS